MNNSWHYEIWQQLHNGEWWPCYRQGKRLKKDYLNKLQELRGEHKDREFKLFTVTTRFNEVKSS